MINLREQLIPLGVAVCVLVTGCRRDDTGASGAPSAGSIGSASSVLSAESEENLVPTTRRAPKQAVGVGKQVEIPPGTLVVGSTPGDRGRDPSLETALWEVKLGGFAIDRLPYPNDPGKPARTDVTRKEAQSLCEERGHRLCTELEWERACKGPNNDAYPTGNGWDPECETHPHSCATGFDVVALGSTLREWTASALEPLDKEDRPLAILRGGRKGIAPFEHRCGRRQPSDAGAHGSDIGFRCCSGTANAATIPRAVPKQTFRRVKLDTAQVTGMIQGIPQLASLGGVSFFKEPDDVEVVKARGDAGLGGNTLTTSPLMWSPDLGEEILVIAGRGASGSSFIAAFHRLPNDRYRIASSLVLKGAPGPIVLAFNGWVKRRLKWSTCWGCLGDEGAVIYRKERRVVIEQL